MITSVPKRWLGMFVFKHAGELILIDKRGNLIADLSYVEGLFRGGNSSLSDHSMLNYGKSLSVCYHRDRDSFLKSPLEEEPSIPFALLFEAAVNEAVSVCEGEVSIDLNDMH